MNSTVDLDASSSRGLPVKLFRYEWCQFRAISGTHGLSGAGEVAIEACQDGNNAAVAGAALFSEHFLLKRPVILLLIPLQVWVMVSGLIWLPLYGMR